VHRLYARCHGFSYAQNRSITWPGYNNALERGRDLDPMRYNVDNGQRAAPARSELLSAGFVFTLSGPFAFTVFTRLAFAPARSELLSTGFAFTLSASFAFTPSTRLAFAWLFPRFVVE